VRFCIIVLEEHSTTGIRYHWNNFNILICKISCYQLDPRE
jgi:hypothetical protein